MYVTRKHSSRMHTSIPSTYTDRVCSSIHQMSAQGDPEVNKFEQISSCGHQISLAGGKWVTEFSCRGVGPAGRGLYSEVQCIMGNGNIGHMGLLAPVGE